MSVEAQLQDLLLLFYQCPVGLIEADASGRILKINPAAARMLVPVLEPPEDLTELFGLLARLTPGLLRAIQAEPARLGPLAPGERFFAAGRIRPGEQAELAAVRVEAGRLMLVITDVSTERRLAAREHQIAVELQRAMLGRVDPIEGLQVGVAYRTAQAELQAGGDWYDVIALPDGRCGLVVGDVVGHSLAAAAAMGQLRSAIRASAPWCTDPVQLLERADGLAAGVESAACATVCYAMLDLRGSPRQGFELSYALAGHPPPLLVDVDGGAEYLTESKGLPLATGWQVPRVPGSYPLRPGQTLLLYTDGLLERRSELMPDSERRLRELAGRCGELPVQAAVDELVSSMLGGQPPQDDVCVLAVRLRPDPASAAP